MSSKSLSVSLITLSILIIGVWYTYNQNRFSHTPRVINSSGSTFVSDLVSPFASGQSSSSGDFQENQNSIGTNTISTGTKEITYNATWTPKTLSGVYYQFGVGNPRETDKSVEEITEMNKRCLNYSPKLCDEKTISLNGEFISVSRKEDGTFEDPERQPSRMTPEIEYLVYSFLSNPIIRQSSESCGEYFWINDGIAQGIYLQHDIGFVHQDNWWNPYNIDINRLIFINPNTGRKELNIDLIWTLRTQILFPSATIETTGHYTNTKLTNCLQKHNQLQLLQSHVASHYERLRQAWNGN